MGKARRGGRALGGGQSLLVILKRDRSKGSVGTLCVRLGHHGGAFNIATIILYGKLSMRNSIVHSGNPGGGREREKQKGW